MALTRDFKKTVMARAQADPAFRVGLLTEAAECLQLIDVGVTDLVYKLENGYINYAKGKGSSKAVTLDSPSHDYRIMLSLWRDVVQPYHREP